MRTLKSFMIMTGVFLLLGLFTTNAKAEPTYLGEFCWNVVDNHGEVGTMKLGITHMGGNHYLVQGGLSEANIYVSGSGLLVGNNVVFSMSGTETLDGVEKPLKIAATWEVTIDLATMNGTFWILKIEKWVDGSTNTNGGEGTWEYTSCQ